MYGIGAVARLAQVSVRTLRHYDDIGLLRPGYVDPASGYRYYLPGQIPRLHRILVLRDLGVSLSAISELLAADVSTEQLRGILRLRQAEAAAALAAQGEQLIRVEIRLAQLEEEQMADYDVIIKRLDPVRLVALSADITGPEQIAETGARMWPELHAALSQHQVSFGGLSWMLYEDSGDSERPMRVTTALPIPAGLTIDEDGLTTIELPAVERAATTVVHGAPEDKFADAFQAVHAWIDRSGATSAGHDRELYIDCDGPRETWVTEIQAVLR
jgi:DNA-binding transcriptional MerR regulator